MYIAEARGRLYIYGRPGRGAASVYVLPLARVPALFIDRVVVSDARDVN